MTAREMQIAFERRLRLIDPELADSGVVDSSTIFQLLNAYALRLAQQIYLNEDVAENNTRVQKLNKDQLGVLLTKAKLTNYSINTDEPYHYRFKLPDDYMWYVRSSTTANFEYDWSTDLRIVPNEFVAEEDLNNALTTIHNKIILPNPYVSVCFANNKLALNVLTDKYTTLKYVNLTYYRQPKQFNVIGVDNIDTLSQCELPESMHDAIVDGAVEMFITENKYRLTRNNKSEQ